MVTQIAGEEDFPIEYCGFDGSTPISVERELMDDNVIYTGKIERGGIISKILDKGSVQEDSLSRNNKESLQLYRKKQISDEMFVNTCM